MNSRFTALLTRWRELAPRERHWLGWGLTGLGAVGFIVGIWLPLARNIQHLRDAAPRARDQLIVMRAQAAQAKQMRGNVTATRHQGSLTAFIDQSAQAHGLKAHVRQLEAEGNNAVRLTLDNIGFNELTRWLAELQQQSGIRAEQAQLEAQSAPGLVSGRLLLRSSGS
jgi:type II secretory pathway component PulM